jgi:hypothetical protein
VRKGESVWAWVWVWVWVYGCDALVRKCVCVCGWACGCADGMCGEVELGMVEDCCQRDFNLLPTTRWQSRGE